MRFWASASAWLAVVAAAFYLLKRALFVLCSGEHIGKRADDAEAAVKKAAHRANELTLAGLRPGRDRVASAIAEVQTTTAMPRLERPQLSWADFCRHCLVDPLISNAEGRIQVYPRHGSAVDDGGLFGQGA